MRNKAVSLAWMVTTGKPSTRSGGWWHAVLACLVVLRAFRLRLSMVEESLTASGAGLRSAEATGDLAAPGRTARKYGQAHSQAYNLDRSEEYLTRTLQIRRQVGDQRSLSLTLNRLGVLHVRRHHLKAARSVSQETLDIYAELQDGTWVPIIRENLTEALIGLRHSRLRRPSAARRDTPGCALQHRQPWRFREPTVGFA